MPDSISPTRGPPRTTAMCSAESRPRYSSGVVTCTMVERKRADTASAPPATARASRASGSHRLTPNTAIATPHTTMQAITACPCRRTRAVQPVVAIVISAPSPGAACNRPKVRAPPWKTLTAIAGNRASGSPNTIAPMSATKVERRTRLPRA